MSVYLGYIEYKVKIYEEIHLEDDPHFPCRTYSTPGEYDACLEAEYVRQTVDLMDCTPPWMTDSQEVWCRDSVNLTQEQAKRINYHLGRYFPQPSPKFICTMYVYQVFILDLIIHGTAEADNCLVPCTTAW